MGMFRENHFVLQKVQTHQVSVLDYKRHGIAWNSACLDYSELAKIIIRAVGGKNSAQVTERCKILGNSVDEDVEILEDHGCPKNQDLDESKTDEKWVCGKCTFRRKANSRCAERKAALFGNW